MKSAPGENLQLSRRAFLFLCGSASSSLAMADPIAIIFADESWYRARPEREEEYTGTLRKVQPPSGPNSRSALRYTFQTGSQSLAVYAPSAIRQLDRAAGSRITARGKLVDLRSEGFGVELWIGSIRINNSTPQK